MTKVITQPITQVHAGDVMLNHSTGHLVDVVQVNDTVVHYRDRANYSGPTGSYPTSDFILEYSWVRNSPVLLSCWQDLQQKL